LFLLPKYYFVFFVFLLFRIFSVYGPFNYPWLLCYTFNYPWLLCYTFNYPLLLCYTFNRFSDTLLIYRPFMCNTAGPIGRAVYGVGLRPLAYWDCGFESHWSHGCLFVVSVVCYQVEVSASGWSFVQRSPTDCGLSLCVT
jgi:hypothetical protein